MTNEEEKEKKEINHKQERKWKKVNVKKMKKYKMNRKLRERK